MKFTKVTWYSKILALILLIALPFIGFYAGVWYQKQIYPNQDNSGIVVDDGKKEEPKTVVDSQKVKLKTSFKNGVLNYSGSVSVPTPCHELDVETIVAESYPEQVQIRIKIQDPKEGTVCAQVVTEKEFSGRLKVSENASISVYLNDEKVE